MHFSLHAPPLTALTLAIIAVPTFLFSQKNNPVPDSAVLKTVVIQATRTGEHSPVPHNNFSREKLETFYQAQDMPMLLTSVPSLVENSDAGNGIGYTGMRIRGSDPTRINVTINGIPLNDAESQGVFWVDLPDLAASAAEIQVQRGVGTSSNGAGAFGATVNIDLSRIDPLPNACITNTLGSFGTRKHSAQFGSGLIHGRWAFSGRLSQIYSNGYVDRATANLKSYHLSGAYIDDRQSFLLHTLSGHEVTYQAWNGLPAQYLDDPALRTFNSAGTERPGAPYPDEVDDYTQKYYLAHYKRLLFNSLQLQLNGHYTRGFGFYEQYKADQFFEDYGFDPPHIADSLLEQTDLIRRRWLDNHFYGGTFALKWVPKINPPALQAAPEFILGGAFNRYDGRHYGEVIWADYGISKDARYYDNNASKYDGNIFGKIELHFKQGLSTFADLQYRQIRYTFLGYDQFQRPVAQMARLNFFNPKLGLTWEINPQYTVYAFWGIGRREPNRDDYTQSTPASRPMPETLFDWEAGLKWKQGTWQATINLFYMKYLDQLVLDGRINDVGAYIRTNVASSYRTGAELETSFQLFPTLRFLGNLALSRNKVSEFMEYLDNWDTGGQELIRHQNTDLAFSPPVVARGEIQWDILPNSEKHHLAVSLFRKIRR
ncbi:MAG: TonB-dependent receptor [Lewinellaceae bacterium]|nr:TonB-dependent receptor [Lewinellaceae bacterium]